MGLKGWVKIGTNLLLIIAGIMLKSWFVIILSIINIVITIFE